MIVSDRWTFESTNLQDRLDQGLEKGKIAALLERSNTHATVSRTVIYAMPIKTVFAIS